MARTPAWRKTPIAFVYGLACVWLSLCANNHYLGLRQSRLKLHYRSAIKDGEYWRFVTCVLLFNHGAGLMLQVFTHFLFLSKIELRVFRKKPLQCLSALAVATAMVVGPGYWLKDFKMQVASPIFGTMLMMWCSLLHINHLLPIVGPIQIPGLLLPPLWVGVRYYLNGKAEMKLQGLGLAAGLLMFIFYYDPSLSQAPAKREKKVVKPTTTQSSSPSKHPADTSGADGNAADKED